jgi:hypothetical protein
MIECDGSAKWCSILVCSTYKYFNAFNAPVVEVIKNCKIVIVLPIL